MLRCDIDKPCIKSPPCCSLPSHDPLAPWKKPFSLSKVIRCPVHDEQKTHFMRFSASFHISPSSAAIFASLCTSFHANVTPCLLCSIQEDTRISSSSSCQHKTSLKHGSYSPNAQLPAILTTLAAFLPVISPHRLFCLPLWQILKPMMLRRLKEDVEKNLAPKEETIIEVELTNIQKKYYRAILEKNFSFLAKVLPA